MARPAFRRAYLGFHEKLVGIKLRYTWVKKPLQESRAPLHRGGLHQGVIENRHRTSPARRGGADLYGKTADEEAVSG